MTNSILVVFGFLEFVLRFLVVFVLACTIMGFVILMEYDRNLGILRPVLWQTLDVNIRKR